MFTISLKIMFKNSIRAFSSLKNYRCITREGYTLKIDIKCNNITAEKLIKKQISFEDLIK